MARKIFYTCTVQITGKCICKTFPPSLHDLIIRPHAKQFPHKFAQKSLFPHEKLSEEKKRPLPFFFWGGDTMLYLHMLLWYKLWPFKVKLPSHCVFKVIQCCYEIFQTVVSLNCKII